MTDHSNTDDETDATPFDSAVQTVQDAVTTRRRFLAGSTAAGLGALAFGTTGAAAQNSDDEDDATNVEATTSDVDVLNYALTLEHLEDAFYEHNLKSLGGHFSAETLREADAFDHLSEDTREDIPHNLEDIGDHEAAHVETLESVIEDLGGTPVERAEYEFGTAEGSDPTAFVQTAMALENTGVAAYAGAAPLIDIDDLLSAALSVHSVEARHAAYLNLLNGGDPFPTAFDESKTMADVLEIAGQFIVD